MIYKLNNNNKYSSNINNLLLTYKKYHKFLKRFNLIILSNALLNKWNLNRIEELK